LKTQRAYSNKQWSDAVPFWALPNALSIDTALIAYLWQRLLSKTLENPLSSSQIWVLMLSTWLVYTGDRWLDARHLKLKTVSSYRHALCLRFRKAYLWTWCCLLIVNVGIALCCLSKRDLLMGTALLILCIGYTSWTQFTHTMQGYFKEWSVSIIFALGIFIFVCTPNSPRTLSGILFVLLTLIFWSNATLLAHWERPIDASHAHGSLAHTAPRLTACSHLVALGTSLMSLTLVPFIPEARTFLLALALSGLGLFCIQCASKDSDHRELHRCLADAALLSPCLGFL